MCLRVMSIKASNPSPLTVDGAVNNATSIVQAFPLLTPTPPLQVPTDTVAATPMRDTADNHRIRSHNFRPPMACIPTARSRSCTTRAKGSMEILETAAVRRRSGMHMAAPVPWASTTEKCRGQEMLGMIRVGDVDSSLHYAAEDKLLPFHPLICYSYDYPLLAHWVRTFLMCFCWSFLWPQPASNG
jgi:hypothetical protein